MSHKVSYKDKHLHSVEINWPKQNFVDSCVLQDSSLIFGCLQVFSNSFVEEEFHGQVDRLYNIKYKMPSFLFSLCLDLFCRDFAVIYLFKFP